MIPDADVGDLNTMRDNLTPPTSASKRSNVFVTDTPVKKARAGSKSAKRDNAVNIADPD